MKRFCIIAIIITLSLTLSGCNEKAKKLEYAKSKLILSISSAQEEAAELGSCIYDIECVIDELRERNVDTEKLEEIETALEELQDGLDVDLEEAHMYYEDIIELENEEYESD